MSDDWTKKYLDAYKGRQQEKRETQERTRLARAVAPDMFQRIKNRVQRDLQTFHDAGTLHSLQFNDMEAQVFAVNDLSPRPLQNPPTVIVELDMIVVKYAYHFPHKTGEKSVRREEGALRICADLNGVTQVYRNGSGEAFTDESDISEFLLRPLLDYVDSY